ncbi:MAG: hypothetical protein VB912_17135, partial [Pirellulaceae bacterium]
CDCCAKGGSQRPVSAKTVPLQGKGPYPGAFLAAQGNEKAAAEWGRPNKKRCKICTARTIT